MDRQVALQQIEWFSSPEAACRVCILRSLENSGQAGAGNEETRRIIKTEHPSRNSRPSIPHQNLQIRNGSFDRRPVGNQFAMMDVRSHFSTSYLAKVDVGQVDGQAVTKAQT
jgi:hypothetical protein